MKKRCLPPLVFLFILYLLASSFALSEFIRYPGFGSMRAEFGGERFFGDMVYARAPRPYVERVLVPWLVRAGVALTPQQLKANIEAGARRWYTREGKPDWLYNYPYEFLLVRFLLFACLVGFAFALRRLAQLTLDVHPVAHDLVPAIALLGLPGLYGYGSMLYDLPALFLFTLGLVLIARRRLGLYAAVFVLALLNKETALLLTLVWVIVERRRLKFSHLALGAGVQVIAWLAVRGLLAWFFRNNPGDEIALHLFRNFDVLVIPRNWVLFRPITDWLVLPMGFNVLYVAGFIWALIALRRSAQFLNDAFWIALPLGVLSLLFGNVDEMRVYYELLPIVFLVLAGSAYRLLGYGPEIEPRKHETHESCGRITQSTEE